MYQYTEHKYHRVGDSDSTNGQPLEINKPLDIIYQNPPTREVMPVKDPGVGELSEGAFSTTATLLAEYL